MEPNYLKSKELSYEISVRGKKVAGDVESNRKILRALLSREKKSLVVPAIKSHLEFVPEDDFTCFFLETLVLS